MNTKLVDSLVQLIESLSPAERTLLEEKLNARGQKPNPQEEYRLLVALREKIYARRGGQPFDPRLDQYLYEGRDERTALHDELVRGCFSKESP
jgi:hypothetical protein